MYCLVLSVTISMCVQFHRGGFFLFASIEEIVVHLLTFYNDRHNNLFLFYGNPFSSVFSLTGRSYSCPNNQKYCCLGVAWSDGTSYINDFFHL